MKQMETKTVTVGENTFYITPFPAMTAANVFGQLVKFVTPIAGGIASLAGGDKKDTSVFDMDIDAVAPALTMAAASLSGDKLEELVRQLMITHKNIVVDDPSTGEAVRLTKDIVNEMFCGEIQDMFTLAIEVVKVNYSGFFRKTAARFGPVIAALTKAADTINTATSTPASSEN